MFHVPAHLNTKNPAAQVAHPPILLARSINPAPVAAPVALADVADDLMLCINGICVWTRIATESYAAYKALESEHRAARSPSNKERLVELKNAAFDKWDLHRGFQDAAELELFTKFGIKLPGVKVD